MKKPSMFSKNFFPTPREAGLKMLEGLDLCDKWILEPHAGKGNLIELIQERGGRVIACELNQDLAIIAKEKCDKWLKADFFETKKDEVSHISHIIMNPPFENGVDHLLHAWEIAPDGCKIVSLLNAESLSNNHTNRKQQVVVLVKDHGEKIDIGRSFHYSERPTDVSISMVKLTKPGGQSDEWAGYFDLNEEAAQNNQAGIMPHNEVLSIVNRYVGAIKLWDEVMEANNKINSLAGIFGASITFGAKSRDQFSTITRDDYKKELQRAAWKYIFNRFNMGKFVTQKLMEELNKFVEQQTQVPFTVKNVYRMLEMIVGTQEARMKRVIVEIFDRLTSHYHDNRMQLPGWKTNSEYRVNKRFILHWGDIEHSWSGKMSARCSSGYIMDDLTKAMCVIAGKNYDEVAPNQDPTSRITEYVIPRWWSFVQKLEFGQWYEFGFFKFKGYKKGTVHAEFLNENEWNLFNKIACEEKGFALASKFTSDYRAKKTDIVIKNVA